MSNPYVQHTTPDSTPVSEPLVGREKEMVPNHGGGVAFAIDEMSRLRRFLILGTEGGTYYLSERKHTLENVAVVVEAVKKNPMAALQEVLQICVSGRAMKKDPAIWTLAFLLKKAEAVEVRRAAAAAVPQVCTIGTDLLMLAESIKSVGGGWGQVTHRAFEGWLRHQEPRELAFQVMKYQSRQKWAMRDLLRKVKPAGDDGSRGQVFGWVARGVLPEGSPDTGLDAALHGLWAFEQAKNTKDIRELVKLIERYRLPRECVPTEALNDPRVWEALLPHMGATALVRNLGKMTSIGLLAPLSGASKLVSDKISSEEYVRRGKLHPLRTLVARKVYESGHGEKGSLTWRAVPQIVDALDSAFYLGFGALQPTGKKHLLALDVSGSMQSQMSGTSLSCYEATAALAMIRARLESQFYVMGFSQQFVDLGITSRMTLGEAMARTHLSDFGSTNCSLPMQWASTNNIEVDVVEIYTDNEANTGGHPTVALESYRRKMGRKVKQVVVGMTSTGFSIADPSDPDQLDVVGFDAALPEVVNSFLGT